MSSHETFELADFKLQRGLTLPRAVLAYRTYGQLNAARSNAILYPTSYAAQHSDIDWLVVPGRILDPERWFIIIPNMFGNGLSSSPSNLPEPLGGRYLDLFTHVDNVAAQRRLLEERFGIERLAMVYGWSMGAQQALHWGALWPERIERIVAICGSAKTSPHNLVFLEGIRAALTADPTWRGDHFVARPETGLRAMARVYAGWALSQAFYRDGVYRTLGYQSLEDYLVRDWEGSFLRRDAGNLVSMINTWRRCDISDNDVYRGDLDRALGAITARTLIMPGSHDLYFTAHDAELDARRIPNAKYLPIPSIWGHRAGNPMKNLADERFIAAAVESLLRE
ncbi:MAG TPA: alpha/beta fold hydrolase [Pirellulales bacterium]|jgi:homoserine O-acetyltransferase|nr:alpha/beta fold hydrolase [Pirellulales bacterium]